MKLDKKSLIALKQELISIRHNMMKAIARAILNQN